MTAADDGSCPYCKHPDSEHEIDSACECNVPGCDCTLGKVAGALGFTGPNGEPLR